MKPKDTVMSDEQVAHLKMEFVKETGITRPDIRAYVFAVRDKQAELSFKAGYDQALKDHNLDITTSDSGAG